ncbi:hypothetical protein [Iodidimonas sp. MBR-14]|jgi:hypothetical protein|uniref:hypothetical protein n=2 Tax=Iodidimonas TaxID=2066486 RepID=UPI0024832B7C|nr:hypothetical protein [Iodidimonas sp. MBR-14]
MTMRSYTGSGVLALYSDPRFRDYIIDRVDLYMKEKEEGVYETQSAPDDGSNSQNVNNDD